MHVALAKKVPDGHLSKKDPSFLLGKFRYYEKFFVLSA